MSDQEYLNYVIRRIRQITVRLGNDLKVSGFEILATLEPWHQLKDKLESKLGIR